MTNSQKQSGDSRRNASGSDPLDPHGEIAMRLRELYAAVEQEPIPTELIDLLEKLDEAEQKQ